jgi:DeoR/GlpR family transcriptional regulator of sugar metabolism
MIAAGDKVALLVDDTKFPGTGMVRICGPEDLDVVVTNVASGAAGRTALEEAGVLVMQVSPVRA